MKVPNPHDATIHPWRKRSILISTKFTYRSGKQIARWPKLHPVSSYTCANRIDWDTTREDNRGRTGHQPTPPQPQHVPKTVIPRRYNIPKLLYQYLYNEDDAVVLCWWFLYTGVLRCCSASILSGWGCWGAIWSEVRREPIPARQRYQQY
jgi:hypothetical protein